MQSTFRIRPEMYENIMFLLLTLTERFRKCRNAIYLYSNGVLTYGQHCVKTYSFCCRQPSGDERLEQQGCVQRSFCRCATDLE